MLNGFTRLLQVKKKNKRKNRTFIATYGAKRLSQRHKKVFYRAVIERNFFNFITPFFTLHKNVINIFFNVTHE